jgi:DnaK suppressor protein
MTVGGVTSGCEKTRKSMDTSRINKLRGILESRRDSLSERVQNRNAIAIENAADVMDEVRLAEERDLATRILERDFTDIRLVEAALTRIEDGTYGFCLRCDETISWNRLRVMPDAAFCVNCQEAAERDGANVFSLIKSVTGAFVA